MDRKKVILLVCALMIAAVTAFMARSMFTGGGASPNAVAQKPVPTGPQVMVATRALPVGTIITADSIRYQPWPAELIEEAYFMKKEGEGDQSETLVGTVVRTPITAGQPITQGSIVAPGDRGFLAAALGPGMRAVSVPVSALTGVSGFVFPGDRVDLVLTQVDKASRYTGGQVFEGHTPREGFGRAVAQGEGFLLFPPFQNQLEAHAGCVEDG